MSKIVKAAHQHFKNAKQASCIFGSRVSQPAKEVGELQYWTSGVEIIQPLRDQRNDVLCYLVDDPEHRFVGIAVLDTHNGCKGLRVLPQDMVSYTDDAHRSQCIDVLRSKLH